MSVVVTVQPSRPIVAKVNPLNGTIRTIEAVVTPPTGIQATVNTAAAANVQIEVPFTGGSNQTGITLHNMGAVPRVLNDLDDVTLLNTADNQVLVYRANTGQFENQTINLTGGGVNQVLVKKSNTNYDYQWEDMVINLPETTYTKLIDQANSTVMYLGEAAPNTSESSASWRLQKILFDATGNVEEVRYTLSGLFTGVWDNRISYTYT